MRVLFIPLITLLFVAEASTAGSDSPIAAPDVRPPVSQASPQTPKIETKKESDKPVNDQSGADNHSKEEPDTSLTVRPHEQKCCKDAEEHGNEGTEFWPPFHGYRVKVTDTALAAFTGLLFLATLALWWSTRDLVKGHEKTAERQLRAYIGVKSADMSIERTENGPLPRANILLTNFGQTPAYKMFISGSVRNATKFEFIKDRKPEPFVENMILNPGHDFNIHLRMKEWNIPEEDGKGFTFVFGRITYRDAFNRKRFVNLRFTASHIAGHTKTGLSPCEEGNEAD